MEAVEEMYSTIDAIGPNDVLAAANRYMLKNRRTVALLRGE
jgi:hypothetical protein